MDPISHPAAASPLSDLGRERVRRLDAATRSLWLGVLLRMVQTFVVAAVAIGAAPSLAQAESGKLVVKLHKSLRRDQVLIYVDSLPVSTRKVARGLKVANGNHIVEVVWPEGETARFEVEVDGGTERITVREKPVAESAPAAPATEIGFPIWPSVAATTAAAAGAVISTVFLVSFAQSFVAYNDAVATAVAAPKEGSVAPLVIVTNRVATKRVALDSDGIATAILVPATVASVGASIALWVWWAQSNPNSSPFSGE